MFADLRYALRSLLRAPRFTLMAVLVLALGIGANSAVFTVVDSVLLRPLPYGDPGRVMVILASSEQRGGRMPVTPGDFQDFREQSQSFDEIAAANVWGPTLTGMDHAERLEGLRASATLFDVLRVKAEHGRLFAADDTRPGAPDVVVLSYDLFQRLCGGDRSVVGRTLTLDGKKHTVIGVTPRGFHFPPFWAEKAEIYSVGTYRAGENGSRGAGYLRLFGRLRRGVSAEQAGAEIRTIAARLAATYPRSNAGLTATVTPIHEMSTGGVRPLLLILSGAVACTLLIACANIANLLIARASMRRREIAIRRSLGADPFRMLRQFLAESTLLSAAGGLSGLLLAWWGVRVFVAAMPELSGFHLPRRNEIEFSGAVVAFNLALCAMTALLCGVVTAVQANRVDLNADLKESGRAQVASRSGRSVRTILTAAEVAIALVLLVGAGLLTESYRKVRGLDPGFDPAGVVAVNVGLAATNHSPEWRAQFYNEALAQFRAMPGVTSASAVNHVPLAGDRFGTSLTLRDHPAPSPENTPNAVYRVVMPGYFSTMRIRLIQGRDFGPADDRNAPGVAIVNASAARQFWPGANPIGKLVHRGDAQSKNPWLSVAGVVADVKQADWTAPVENEIYLPFEQDRDYRENPASFLTMTLVFRGRNAAALAPAVRERIAAIDANISAPHVFDMEKVVKDVMWQQRTAMTLVLLFGGFAALLAAVGLYAVMSFVVAGRAQEIGLRMALGAQRTGVLGLVLRDASRPVLAGMAAGLAVAAGAGRVMTGVLFGVHPWDPAVFGGAAAAVAVIAACACAVPAQRAATLDPVSALRQD